MNLQVAKVEIGDLPDLQIIGAESYLPHYTHLWKNGGLEWYLNRCFSEEFLKNEIADENVEYYIVKNNAEMIGMMKLILTKKVPHSEIENALYLEKIYFTKEWTGKGVGKKLIDAAVRRANELKREYIWLMAMDTSAKPIAAYQKSGFKIHCRTNLGEEFALMKEEFRGMVVMIKELNENK